MKLFPALFNAKAKRDYDLKIGRELVHAQGGVGRIEAVTSSPETLEGGRPSLMIQNETHLWYSNNEGHEMSQTGRRNAGKVGGRVMSITNAPQPGMDSVAERDRRAYEDMVAQGGYNFRLMYDSVEAPSTTPLDPKYLPMIITKIRGDSYWYKTEEVVNEILDKRTPVSQSRRFYLNQVVSTSDVLVADYEWDQCYVEDRIGDGDEVVLGLDVSKSDDATALVAIRISDRLIQPLEIWEIPAGPMGEGQEIDMTLVDSAVAVAFAKYRVRAFFSDVNPVQGYVDKWSDEYREKVLIKATPKSAVGYDMRGNQKEIMQMNEALVGALREQTVRHSCRHDSPRPLSTLRQHALNAYQWPRAFGEEFGMSFRKESRESSRKVDGWAAAVLAYTALNRYLESGRRPAEEQDGSFYLFQ